MCCRNVIHSLVLYYRYSYTPSNVTKSRNIDGTLATYGGGGYVHVINNDPESTNRQQGPSQQILKLKVDVWTDAITRAVFLEFTVYNGNVNLFCIFK